MNASVVAPDDMAFGRRAFLRRSGLGLGALALRDLLLSESQAQPAAKEPHFPARAKRVIFLYMAGGPSHLESFDPKPALNRMHGFPMPQSLTQGKPIAQLQNKELRVMGSQARFRRQGQSGTEISDFFPHIGGIADEITVIRSMRTTQINHDPAHMIMNTGSAIAGRPSMGSWVQYGLGRENENLPGFAVLSSIGGIGPQPISSRQWHSGFLPGELQGVQFRSGGTPIHYLDNPGGYTRERQRDVLDAVNSLNRARFDALGDPETAARIRQYELAYRMQMSVPSLGDFSTESPATLRSYGVKEHDGSFAANCLMARRLAERGVRFIQLYHLGWDHHNDLKQYMGVSARATDQGSAALIADLRQRGLLDDTLVVWGGEFGRTPMAQMKLGKEPGRDHHMLGFSMWLAGGGIRAGGVHGSTDVLGYEAVEDIVEIPDLHATLLHQLGLDHEALVHRYQGRDFRLTDVAGRVVRKLLA